MKKFGKKLILAGLVTAMVMTTLTGCTPSDSKTLATIGDNTLTFGEGNFYARYNQAQYESYAGIMGSAPDTMWEEFIGEDETMEQQMKASIHDTLESMEVLEQFRDDYGVALTDEDQQKISDVADEFIAANDSKTLKIMSGTKENVTRILELLTISNRMHDEMIKDVDTNVSKEEALRKNMEYVAFEYSATLYTNDSVDEDSEKVAEALAGAIGGDSRDTAEQKALDAIEMSQDCKDADEFKELMADEGYIPIDVNFGKDTESPAAVVCKEMFDYKVGELTQEPILDEGTNSFYVCMLRSDYEEEATEQAQKEIADKRQQDQYDSLYEDMKAQLTIKWNENLWKKISFADQGVIMATASDESEAAEEPAEDLGELSTDKSLTSKDGDTVNIDYKGMIDDEAFTGGSDTDVDLTLGSGMMIPGFEDQIIGHHPGETFDIYVTFPDDYGDEQISGKDATFTITLNGIYIKE